MSGPAVLDDVSPRFRGSTVHEVRVARRLTELQQTPEAIRYFDRTKHMLRPYFYWFMLSTCWVAYTGHSDLRAWRRLFSAKIPWRDECLMKPSEVDALAALPDTLTVFRAHRPGEDDWIAYTLSEAIAWRFAGERSTAQLHAYRVAKADVLALFTRRGEQEVLILDRDAPTLATILPRMWTAWAAENVMGEPFVYLACPQGHRSGVRAQPQVACPQCGDVTTLPAVPASQRPPAPVRWAAEAMTLPETLAAEPPHAFGVPR